MAPSWCAMSTTSSKNFQPSRAYTRADRYAPARADSGPQETALRDVWELLDLDIPRHHDEVATQLGITAAELNRRITVLEMGNYIIGDAGGLRRRGPAS